jgi:hypothetical protein
LNHVQCEHVLCTCLTSYMNITKVKYLMKEPKDHFSRTRSLLDSNINGEAGTIFISELLNRGFDLYRQHKHDELHGAPLFVETNFAWVFALGKKFLSVITTQESPGNTDHIDIS